MKNLIIHSICFLSLSIGAQSSLELYNLDNSTLLNPNALINVNTTAGTNIKVNVDIKNISANTNVYKVKRYDVVLNAEALAYYCFAGSCYAPQTMLSPDALTLTAGQLSSQIPGSFQTLIADLDEGSVVGYSLIKYTFFNNANPSDSLQFSIAYNASVGFSELKKNLGSVELFPNPSEGNSTLLLTSQTASNGKVMVYNALGDLVSEQTAYLTQGKNKIQLNLQHLTHGVYLVSITSGNQSLTKRLVIK
ncbi:MAG: T9SS type A sorting domain-containing protein [Bacteroidia bacterium]|jgi:hypothetical protein|nr:T9SS type A sorting domain-containing protein [Bacteroidia bacterium]